MFDVGANLFLKKWQAVSTDLVTYFEKEWLVQNRNWYEGFRRHTPSTNNALEAFNKVIKDEHTLRERLELSHFRVILFSMVEQWSTEYSSGLNTLNSGAPKIELNSWTDGYNFARSNIKITSEQKENKIIYTIPLSSDPTDRDRTSNYRAWKTFGDFKKDGFAFAHASFKYPVTEDNWIFGECDCADGFKLFLCHHLIGIALRLKITEAPAEAKSIPIGQKRKRGRPAKSKPALQFQ